ncbi:MAG: hypothetical protein OXG98_18710 [Gemmatimonadetes bacterium]|nr:hypothetical protein [Gemmatimonadota bacterium]
MKSWKKPTDELVDRTLGMFERQTDRQQFFSQLKNPHWIQPLFERDSFTSPPGVRHLPDGFVQYPPWPELQYLKNVTEKAPGEVVDIVAKLPQTDNPRVYDDILDIVLMLKGEQSVQLKAKITNYAGLQYHLLPHKFADLLVHWTSENQMQAALELAKILVQFHPDPRDEEKRRRHSTNKQNDEIASIDSLLEPSPQFDDWNYQQIMDIGVRSLALEKPFEVACMLVDATANMISLESHQDEFERGLRYDSSEIWCPKLEEQRRDSAESKETLVNTLVNACKGVYAQLSNDSIACLDSVLRNQRWLVFERIRLHLYALYPNDQTKPWIRELILGYSDYAKYWRYPYELQRMINLSCDHFGDALLTEEERTRIFELILSGPEREAYREWVGDQFREADYERWTLEYHRLQLRPFSTCLFGKYATYYQSLLDDETENDVTDDTYLSFRASDGGMFTYRSPKSPEELSAFSDEDLLEFINEWQDEHSDKDDWTIKVNVPALACAFQSVFTSSIIPDDNKLAFWLGEKRILIKRPIFVQHMIQAIQAQIEQGHIERLGQWCEFCQWVISHQDKDLETPIRYADQLREDLSWHSSRRAVSDFVETCLKEEVNVPISAREGLASLLKAICTQFDWALDRRTLENEPYDEAVNSIRGRALRSMVEFGWWIRRNDQESEIKEIESILEQRFSSEVGHPLTIPEYALLGQYFPHIYELHESVAVKNISDFFPKDNLPAWQAGFGQFLCGNGPYMPIFEYVRDDYEFALNHVDGMSQQTKIGREVPDALGEHLFIYYVQGVFPMTGTGSLLERFYRQVASESKRWATLFDHVGRRLRSTGKQQLDETLKDKVYTFYEWRLNTGEPRELREFTFWLEAECLDADWRLDAYSRILEVPKVLDSKFGEPRHASLHTRALRKMIPQYTAKVVDCFAKLISSMPEEGLIYIPSDDAKAILKAGRNQADENVRKTVERTRDDLLRGGQLEFLDLDE